MSRTLIQDSPHELVLKTSCKFFFSTLVMLLVTTISSGHHNS